MLIPNQQVKWHTQRCLDSSKARLKDQEMGGGPNPGNLTPSAKIVGITLPLISIWNFPAYKNSVQFSSVSRVWLYNPMDCSMPGLPGHHQLPEFTQPHVHWVSDAIPPSHPLLSPSPSAFNLSQHQGLSKWVSSSHQVAKILEFQLQLQSFQWIFRTDFL